MRPMLIDRGEMGSTSVALVGCPGILRCGRVGEHHVAVSLDLGNHRCRRNNAAITVGLRANSHRGLASSGQPIVRTIKQHQRLALGHSAPQLTQGPASRELQSAYDPMRIDFLSRCFAQCPCNCPGCKLWCQHLAPGRAEQLGITEPRWWWWTADIPGCDPHHDRSGYRTPTDLVNTHHIGIALPVEFELERGVRLNDHYWPEEVTLGFGTLAKVWG